MPASRALTGHHLPAVGRGDDARSRMGAQLVDELMGLPPVVRRDILRAQPDRDLQVLLASAQKKLGTPFGLWQGDCEGFVTDVIGESLWSKPRQIMAALHQAKRVAVPSCFGSSKTHSVSRMALYWGAVHAPGTALVVTLAPYWRQVYRQVWPEIRRAHARAGLPGRVDTAQWKLVDRNGMPLVVAYGLPANPYAESAVQGIHSPNLLLIVDEAGGIGPVIGRNLRALLTGSNARMVAIGNPPTDDETSWFEGLIDADAVKVIRIAASETPNFTGEKVGRCYSCPPEVPAHPISDHLVDPEWVAETVEEYGEGDAYVTAKVHARFPKGVAGSVIPSTWVQLALDSDDPAVDDTHVRLDELDLPAENTSDVVSRGAWVRLGVDVAAGGGDEFVIARAVGDLVQVRHVSSGAANANAVNVAGRVLEEILHAQALAAALGTAARVRVKVDTIGVGWGVTSTLQAWRSEGMHGADIVPVNVAESTDREPRGLMVPDRKRDEMWLAGRELLQPDKAGRQQLRLRVDRRGAAQMSTPKRETTSAGRVKVESKDSMRRRNVRSPDRAEAVLLAVYEPAPKPRQKARLIA